MSGSCSGAAASLLTDAHCAAGFTGEKRVASGADWDSDGVPDRNRLCGWMPDSRWLPLLMLGLAMHRRRARMVPEEVFTDGGGDAEVAVTAVG